MSKNRSAGPASPAAPIVRSNRWGGATPATDDECRELLLRAAARCFVARGPSRTTMDDIASEASVHRTTVYKYFPNRDAILAGVLFWENDALLAEAEQLIELPGPFVDRIVAAFSHVADGIQQSSLLRRLFDPDTTDMFVRVTAASQEFQERVGRVLAPAVAEAATRGELRVGLGVDEVTDWLATVTLMLLGALFRDEHRDVVEDLRRYVLPGVCAKKVAP